MSEVIGVHALGQLHSLRNGTFYLETTSFEQEIPVSVSSFVFKVVVYLLSVLQKNGLIFYFMR